MVATLRFLNALKFVVGTVHVGTSESPTDPIQQRVDFGRRVTEQWKSIQEASDEFIRTWELAETYLPDNAHQLLERVWLLRADIRGSQMTYFAVPDTHGVKYFNGGWGGDPERAIDAIRVEARSLLRPLAQLAD